MLHEMLIPLRHSEYDTVEANSKFFLTEKNKLWMLSKKSRRRAKHDFALEMVNNMTGACQENLNTLYDVVRGWILVKSDEGHTVIQTPPELSKL